MAPRGVSPFQQEENANKPDERKSYLKRESNITVVFTAIDDSASYANELPYQNYTGAHICIHFGPVPVFISAPI